MKRTITDAELKRICNESRGVCNARCLECDAFKANQRWKRDGERDDDSDSDDNDVVNTD